MYSEKMYSLLIALIMTKKNFLAKHLLHYCVKYTKHYTEMLINAYTVILKMIHFEIMQQSITPLDAKPVVVQTAL